MQNTFDYMFRFTVTGDSNVGKSCLMLRFTDGRYKVEHEPTLGIEFGFKTVTLGDYRVKVQIRDTAGQESFKSITRAYYKGSIAAIIVYDICKRSSFEDVAKWLYEVRSHSTEKVSVILVGNKSDMDSQQRQLLFRREVPTEQAEKYANKNGLQFFETSAFTGDNVENMFKQTANKILKRIQKGEINPQTESHYGVRLDKKIRKPNSTAPSKKLQPDQHPARPKQQCYC